MIAIIDYGMGNLRSVQKAFEQVGHPAVITEDADAIAQAERILLPGVGAFSDAIARLRQTGMDKAVLRAVDAGKYVLGICLGMQLMFEESLEDGRHRGLGLFPGAVTRLDAPGLKIPHVGWNTLTTRDCPLFDAGDDPYVYFVHSYCVQQVGDFTAATCEYGKPFTAAVWRENVAATQFHPEKSGAAGLSMLKRFAEWGASSC